jgi:hypothetical protein
MEFRLYPTLPVENPNAIDLVVEVAKEAAELAPALVLSSSVVAA